MNCTDIRPLLSAYHDGEATPDEKAKAERHLATCAECRRALAEYRTIGGNLRALYTPLPPAELRRDVWRAIEGQQSGRAASGMAAGTGQKGKVTPLRPRDGAAPSIEPAPRRAWDWGKLVPAASLIAAMFLVFVLAFVINRPRQAAASIIEQSPFGKYDQAIHVRFLKPVVKEDVERNTYVVRLEGTTPYTMTRSEVTVLYDRARNELAVKPNTAWQPGGSYHVVIDAANIRTGAGNQTLDEHSILLPMSFLAYTPTTTNTATSTRVPTSTRIPTNTRVPTATPEPTQVVENTAVPQTKAPTPLNTPVVVAATSTPEAQATATSTATARRESTPTVTSTSSPARPSVTVTATATITYTITATVRPVQTGTPTRGATGQATATAQKPTTTLTPRASSTPRATATPLGGCRISPANGFGKLWKENNTLRARLGCATIYELPLLRAAQQRFQGGQMFWRADTLTIYVFLGENGGEWYEFPDTWRDNEPTATPLGPTPPAGLYEPVRGFGKVWRQYPGLRQSLGWALEPEHEVSAAWQTFENGSMLWSGDRVIRVLYVDSNWAVYPDTYVGPTPTVRPNQE